MREKFRPPGRDTFGRDPKSVQKGRLNLRFKNPPTLFFMQIYCLIPRDYGDCLFSPRMTNRPSSCAAAAHCCNGRSCCVVHGGLLLGRRHKTTNKKDGQRPSFCISIAVQLENGHEGFRGNLHRTKVTHLFLARWKSFAFQRHFARQFE